MRSLRTRRGVAATLFQALAALLLVLATAAPLGAQTQSPDPTETDKLIASWDQTAKAVEAALQGGSIKDDALERLRQSVIDQRIRARALATQLETDVTPLRAQLQALGKPEDQNAPEAADLVARRAEIEQQLSAAESRQKQAELAATRAAALEERLATLSRTRLADRLLQRDASVLDWRIWPKAATAAKSLARKFATGAEAAVQQIDPLGDDAAFFAVALGVLAFWLFGARAVDRVIERLIAAVRASGSAAAQIFFGLLLVVARVAPQLITALVIVELIKATGVLAPAGELFLRRLAQAVVIVALTSAFARIYFAPKLAEQRVIDLGDAGSRRAWWQVTLLAFLATLHRIMIDPAALAGADVSLLLVANATIAVLAGPVLYILFVKVCRRVPRPETEAPQTPSEGSRDEPEDEIDFAGGVLAALRILGIAAAIVIPLAAVAGYRELSQFLLYRICLTIALGATAGLIYVAVRRLRSPEEDGHGTLATLMTALILAMASAPALAFIWGASTADLSGLGAKLMDGVTIGDANYSLSDLISALLVLTLGVWLTRFAQRVARRTILPSMRLEPGARDSLLTGLGYVGFFITALLAISAAGLDLSNLALVAGALSVGIGFGLQNIVSNFVSGLILLIERPVKIGDWIIVGGSQGYVRKINVRSTEIETFDRASVIVPNSDLISSQVTNWTHKNLTGRCILKIGVAYDSDPDQVMTILREEAQAHPMTLSYPKPFITFTNFGDSALEFEARVYIRDVNWVLSVHSDLNVAILKRLRKEGIEIPFPQRDLHIRSGLPAPAAPVQGAESYAEAQNSSDASEP